LFICIIHLPERKVKRGEGIILKKEWELVGFFYTIIYRVCLRQSGQSGGGFLRETGRAPLPLPAESQKHNSSRLRDLFSVLWTPHQKYLLLFSGEYVIINPCLVTKLVQIK
jgi:hypothetical protein